MKIIKFIFGECGNTFISKLFYILMILSVFYQIGFQIFYYTKITYLIFNPILTIIGFRFLYKIIFKNNKKRYN